MSGTLTISYYPMSGSRGTYNLEGGTLNVAGGIVNNDTFNFSGGNLNASITNNATGKVEISGGGPLTVNGNVNTWGLFKVTGPGTTVTYTGTFNNYGAYISDPATNKFFELFISPTGYLQGGTGDEFYIGGDFLNNSQNGLWNTQLADLFFTGTGMHDFHLSDLDQANTWFTLSLLDGGTLNLSSDMLVRLYVNSFSGDLSKIFNTGAFDIFIYDSDDGTLISRLAGSQQPVPVPSTLLLFGSGLLGAIGIMRRRFKKN